MCYVCMYACMYVCMYVDVCNQIGADCWMRFDINMNGINARIQSKITLNKDINVYVCVCRNVCMCAALLGDMFVHAQNECFRVVCISVCMYGCNVCMYMSVYVCMCEAQAYALCTNVCVCVCM